MESLVRLRMWGSGFVIQVLSRFRGAVKYSIKPYFRALAALKFIDGAGDVGI